MKRIGWVVEGWTGRDWQPEEIKTSKRVAEELAKQMDMVPLSHGYRVRKYVREEGQ